MEAFIYFALCRIGWCWKLWLCKHSYQLCTDWIFKLVVLADNTELVLGVSQTFMVNA